MTWGIVREWDSETVRQWVTRPAVGCRLTAFGWAIFPKEGGAAVPWAEGGGIALMGDEYMPPKAAIKWRRQAPTSPAAAILHNYPGRSPQPVREAQPVPDRTLAAQGRQARWLPQPSRPYGRVNLREYSLAPYWCREAGRFAAQFHFPP